MNVGAILKMLAWPVVLTAVLAILPVRSLGLSLSTLADNPKTALSSQVSRYEGDWYAVAGLLMTLIVVIVLPQKEH